MYRVAQLLYLMLPVYLANMAPPLVKYWRGWNRPISVRLLGSHKTVMGVAFALVAAVVTTLAQRQLHWEGGLIDYDRWLLFGLVMGASAMLGDSLKSLIKRRRGIAPGQSWMPADQLDFVLAGLIALRYWVAFTWADIALVLGISFAGALLVNRMAYQMGIRDTPR